MKLLTDEQLCACSINELIFMLDWAKKDRLKAAQKNQWLKHEKIGEYIHKIEFLITPKK